MSRRWRRPARGSGTAGGSSTSSIGGKLVLDAETSFAISSNPGFHFYVVPAGAASLAQPLTPAGAPS